MADLIDREKVIKALNQSYNNTLSYIRVLECAEPKKGEWIETSNGSHSKCSCCGAPCPVIEDDDNYGQVIEWWSAFCPNCGADMRGDSDDNNT